MLNTLYVFPRMNWFLLANNCHLILVISSFKKFTTSLDYLPYARKLKRIMLSLMTLMLSFQDLFMAGFFFLLQNYPATNSQKNFWNSPSLTCTTFIVLFLFLLTIRTLYRLNFTSIQKSLLNVILVFYFMTARITFLNLNTKMDWSSMVQARNTDLIQLYRWDYLWINQGFHLPSALIQETRMSSYL